MLRSSYNAVCIRTAGPSKHITFDDVGTGFDSVSVFFLVEVLNIFTNSDESYKIIVLFLFSIVCRLPWDYFCCVAILSQVGTGK